MPKLRSRLAGEVIKHAIEAKCLFSGFTAHAAAAVGTKTNKVRPLFAHSNLNIWNIVWGKVWDCRNLILIEVLESVVSIHVLMIFREIRLNRTPSCFFLD